MSSASSSRSTGASGAWAFADGSRIDPVQRYVYRLRPDLQRTYPDPFLSGGASYQGWWARSADEEYPFLFDAVARGAETRRLANALRDDLG
jgi:hypothetical protein